MIYGSYRKIRKALFHVVLIILLAPYAVAGQGLIPCSGIDCRLCDIFTLISNVTGFILGTVVPLIATFTFVIGGIKFYTAMGDPGKIADARKMLINVLIGLVIVYTAHLLITTILCTLGYADCQSWNRMDFCN